MSDPAVAWNEWGPPVRVRVEHGPVTLFVRAVKDGSPIYASERAAVAAGFERVPVSPTFTFAMTHSRRGPMEVTHFQTRWCDLDGTPVVDEQIVSLCFPRTTS